MKFSLNYFDGILEVKTSGEAEYEQFREILEAMVNHENWKHVTPFIINHTDLKFGPLTVADIQNIAELNS